MPDILGATERATEIIMERTQRVLKVFQASLQPGGGSSDDAMQRQQQAAYQAVTQAPPALFAAAHAAFAAQYGPDAWLRQQSLGLRHPRSTAASVGPTPPGGGGY